ncbi:hypothetical protein RSOLAG1IB_07934 [Rhizoctonia solani AG-1 IB]|uniref:Uncharacterized protein n=1 Tax=Thanatephorus cucumeris (strain AG1-IB / isolate 7/3/14) TaxID=1108050 RepID=A0A0B7FG65_THACB|nr:hypothetical protein RSOLAG1IB_07934 [Rhizoctonia solani AG-1 IB]
MSGSFLNEDVVAQVVFYLPDTRDRISLAFTTRWCYFTLKRFVYDHIVLHPDGPAFDIIPRLLKDRSLCTHVTQLDVMLSTRPQYTTYVPGKDDVQHMWQQQDKYIQDVTTIMKHMTQLKGLRIEEGKGGAILHSRLSLELKFGCFPFNLTSFRLGSFAPGALEFIGAHSELSYLVLTHLTNCPHGADDLASLTARFQAPAVDFRLMKLGALWATPWWTRVLLTRCDVHTFGLLDKSQSTGTQAQLILDVEIALSISPLVTQGGHRTVRSLALPLDYFIMTRPTLNLDLISRAFPLVEKIAITLEPGKGFSSAELLEAIKSYTAPEALQDTIFESATELCFLLPGEWPHEGSAPHKVITKQGKDVDYAIPHFLTKLMPKLAHVDTPDRCYCRAGAGVKKEGGSVGGCNIGEVFGLTKDGEYAQVKWPDNNAWFGRARGECWLPRSWI